MSDQRSSGPLANELRELEEERDAWKALAHLRAQQIDKQRAKKEGLWDRLLRVLVDVDTVLGHAPLTRTPIPDHPIDRLRREVDDVRPFIARGPE